MASDADDFPKALKPLRFHGAYPRSGPYQESGDDLVGTCPFCGKRRAFVAHTETGRWVCHSKPTQCGRSGNAVSFLSQFAEVVHAATGRDEWRELVERRRGIPAEAFRPHGVGYHAALDRWVVPVFNPDDKVTDLRVMNPTGKKMGTAGRSAGCWNLNKVAEAVANGTAPGLTLYVNEGEWDGMPWDWLLTKSGAADFLVCAIPGARTVKDEWAELWQCFARVIVLPDNDADGDAMAEKCWQKLNGKTELAYLNWPDTLADGYDVSDFIVEHHIEREKPAKRVVRELLKLVNKRARRMPFKGQENAEVARGETVRVKVERPASNPSFNKTLNVYRQYLRMTDAHVLALQFCYSVYLTTQWDDVPVWGFLVGSPGAGKSELLCSLDGSPEAVFYSSMQSKALVSGFKADPDPSLIPEMIGRCAVFKDWTELLTGNQLDLQQTYSTLRGWYDGHVKRHFGNGVDREYIGRGNILAGVTNLIHAQNDSVVGERFLKFQLPKQPRREADAVVMAAMLATAQEAEKNDALKQAATAFLNRDTPKLVPVDVCREDYLRRILALVGLVALLRTKVEYTGHGYDRELSYRPEAELPTRLGKQLVKLAMANTVVLGKRRVDEESFRLVERVAFDTAHGFHLDIIQALMKCGGQRVAIDDLMEVAKMPRTTLDKRLTDLQILGAINRASVKTIKTVGRTAYLYSVVPSIRRLWDAAEVADDHINPAVESRRTRKGYE